jgi:hypothetical protein
VKTARLSVGKRKGAGNRKRFPLSWSFSRRLTARIAYEQARKYVHRKRSKTNGIIAIRALAHKLARASYHVIRDQVDFDPVRVFGA